jgi:hypothetical protein
MWRAGGSLPLKEMKQYCILKRKRTLEWRKGGSLPLQEMIPANHLLSTYMYHHVESQWFTIQYQSPCGD